MPAVDFLIVENMKANLVLSSLGVAFAAPSFRTRQTPCFVTGTETLPSEVLDVANSLADTISCDFSQTTIFDLPDVTSNSVSFSSINFANSDSTPLQFALDTFATTEPLAENDLSLFQDELNTYLATEAGVRSVGGSLEVKVPKFFLQFQIARIDQAQGIDPADEGDTVEHQLEKVLSNAAGEDQSLLDQVSDLATTLE